LQLISHDFGGVAGEVSAFTHRQLEPPAVDGLRCGKVGDVDRDSSEQSAKPALEDFGEAAKLGGQVGYGAWPRRNYRFCDSTLRVFETESWVLSSGLRLC